MIKRIYNILISFLEVIKKIALFNPRIQIDACSIKLKTYSVIIIQIFKQHKVK